MADERHDPGGIGAAYPWREYVVGAASLVRQGATLKLITNDARASAYTDGQVDDYRGLRRSQLPWRPPLTLEVQARFSHSCGALRGTAGFGFWNHPVLLPGTLLPAMPAAIWFFYASPPSDMRLDGLAPGWGWKAATIDASRWPFLALAPTAPLGVLLMRQRFLRRALWPIAQVALGVREAPIAVDMRHWHRYTLRWEEQRVRFWVDGLPLLEAPFAPAGPLGCVLWIDNQYAIVTPEGRFGGGLLDAPGEQWLEIQRITIEH